ncbi:SDR family oxidoreductase [Pseudoroseomonas cervicalis]|uniref:SDR family oxidoreductase n=1 Tax=Teichococcus cervicalis TaxID=204525 RepID=UPI002784AE86|nr:SDR family oxidoreductase [Pseudoroseomonas cervicalis]MDQ1078531.1 NAD(P)-dependent dehydrogenase (short-subunit alcohol dehydrogenase family) [Pseudoroseomonas cervicalis]
MSDSPASPSPSRVALVTGAAHGIGAGIAARLQREGWHVVTADLKPGAAGSRHVIADIADEGAVTALVQGVAAQEGRLDALVCNAGIMIRKPIVELSLAEWRRVLDTNLTSTFLLARAAHPLLKAARGSIVTIASTRARMSEANTESYSASKGGIVALTHSLAISLGPEVRANCISPGWIDVEGEALRPEDHAQHPAGRVGRVDDIASLAAWLVGPDAGFVTGADFVSDGGMTRKMIYAE